MLCESQAGGCSESWTRTSNGNRVFSQPWNFAAASCQKLEHPGRCIPLLFLSCILPLSSWQMYQRAVTGSRSLSLTGPVTSAGRLRETGIVLPVTHGDWSVNVQLSAVRAPTPPPPPPLPPVECLWLHVGHWRLIRRPCGYTMTGWKMDERTQLKSVIESRPVPFLVNYVQFLPHCTQILHREKCHYLYSRCLSIALVHVERKKEQGGNGRVMMAEERVL